MTNALFLMGMPGGYEWIIIGVIILLLFGGRKLPELMKGMGKGIKEFKDASKQEEDPKQVEEDKK
ncbi:MAG: twin-arginine translocase TatA/TatE family subunit [Salibacteraceae bacterium]